MDRQGYCFAKWPTCYWTKIPESNKGGQADGLFKDFVTRRKVFAVIYICIALSNEEVSLLGTSIHLEKSSKESTIAQKVTWKDWSIFFQFLGTIIWSVMCWCGDVLQKTAPSKLGKHVTLYTDYIQVLSLGFSEVDVQVYWTLRYYWLAKFQSAECQLKCRSVEALVSEGDGSLGQPNNKH